jgi:hypothetical protein
MLMSPPQVSYLTSLFKKSDSFKEEFVSGCRKVGFEICLLFSLSCVFAYPFTACNATDLGALYEVEYYLGQDLVVIACSTHVPQHPFA